MSRMERYFFSWILYMTVAASPVQPKSTRGRHTFPSDFVSSDLMFFFYPASVLLHHQILLYNFWLCFPYFTALSIFFLFLFAPYIFPFCTSLCLCESLTHHGCIQGCRVHSSGIHWCRPPLSAAWHRLMFSFCCSGIISETVAMFHCMINCLIKWYTQYYKLEVNFN